MQKKILFLLLCKKKRVCLFMSDIVVNEKNIKRKRDRANIML
jgi:hypothetical protein